MEVGSGVDVAVGSGAGVGVGSAGNVAVGCGTGVDAGRSAGNVAMGSDAGVVVGSDGNVAMGSGAGVWVGSGTSVGNEVGMTSVFGVARITAGDGKISAVADGTTGARVGARVGVGVGVCNELAGEIAVAIGVSAGDRLSESEQARNTSSTTTMGANDRIANAPGHCLRIFTVSSEAADLPMATHHRRLWWGPLRFTCWRHPHDRVDGFFRPNRRGPARCGLNPRESWIR